MARGTPSRPETVNRLGMREGYLMNGYGKRILVVNEDADRRALLEAQLEQEGYAVQTACDGVAGQMRCGNDTLRPSLRMVACQNSAATSSLHIAESRGLTLPSFSFPEISST